MFRLSSSGSWGLQEVPGEQRCEALSKIGTGTEDRKRHSNSQSGTSGNRSDQGEPVTCTAEIKIRKKQLSHHGKCGGESDWKKKRRQVKSLSGYLPWSRKCQVCPSPSTPTKRVCSGSGGQGNEWRPNYSRGKAVVTVPWSGLENRVKQETGSFCSSRPRERLRRCRVHDHLGAACKQATPELGPEKGGVVSSTFSTFLQASWGWKGEV